MSLDNADIVDAVSTENEGDIVVLSIIDGWGWENRHEHLLALQNKLNAYFEFIESGQVYDAYPDAKGKLLSIEIVSRFPPPEVALAFLEQASTVAAKLNVTVNHWVR